MGYKCVNCGAEKQDGEDYWQVKIITTEGRYELVPTCSEECAINVQKRNMLIHEMRVNSVKYQQFQRIKWGKY